MTATITSSNLSHLVVKSYIHRCKVACALAIIRSKPEDVTSQQYTKELCSLRQRQQIDYQRRAQDLEVELLKVKQVGLMEMIEIDNDRLAMDDSDVDMILTPPCSLRMKPVQVVTKAEETVHQYTLFLKSILQLKPYSQRTEICEDLKMKTTVEESILKYMEMIQTLITSWNRNGMLSFPILDHSVSILVSVLDSIPVKNWSGTISQGLQQTLRILVRHMVGQDVFNKKNYPEQLSCLLLLFGKSKQFRFSVLECLLSELHFFSDHLRQVCHLNTPLQVKQYENMYFVFKVCEEILKLECSLDESSQEIMNVQRLDRLQNILMNCLLHISDDFPLFGHYVWRLGALTDALVHKANNEQ